jgi:prepilin-type N-terminal cleavage/methylation domain-containing protein
VIFEECDMKEKGFSLIELLIVVAIIGVVSAIAIPGLLRSKKAAYEANAVRYLKSWLPGQELYKKSHGFYSMTDEELVREGFINKSLNSSNTADDTAFTYDMLNNRTNPDGTPNTSRWWGTANRRSALLATRSFYIDQSGLIRAREAASAGVLDPPFN